MLALSINVGITFLLVICCAILFGSLKNSQSARYVGVLRPLLHRLKIAKHIRARFRDTNTLPDCLASLDLARNGYDADDFDGTVDALSSLVDNLEGEGEGDERLFGIRCSAEILSTLGSTIFAFATFIASFFLVSSNADSSCAPFNNMAQQLCALNQGEGQLGQMCFNAK